MILSAPIILTMVPRLSPLRNAAVVIQRGIIVDVGPDDIVNRRYPGHRKVRFQNGVLLPGLVNVHTHLELPPLLETIRARTLPEWVMNLIAAKKSLGTSDYRKATSRNTETLIRTGTTTVGEICTHNVSPALLKQNGLRSVVYHEIISMGPPSQDGDARRLSLPHSALRIPKSALNRPAALVTHGLSPHAPHTVSKEALLAIKRFAGRGKIPLAMHVAESKDETRLLRRQKSGFDRVYEMAGWDRSWAPSAPSSVEYLMKLHALGPDFLAIHAVHVNDSDIAILKKRHTPVAHCPRSNKETRVGTMRLREFLDAGITVGLGTDSLASSPSLSLWDEMRAALMIHRKSGITAEQLFRMATIGGAQALGLAEKIGTIEAGRQADLIAVPLPQKNTGDLYNDLLRETESSNMTMVNGKILRKE